MRIVIRPLGPVFAAEVTDVNLCGPLDDTEFAAIESALLQHAVIVLRNQQIDDEAQVAFSERFGALEEGGIMRGRARRIANPKIGDVSNLSADGDIIVPGSQRAAVMAADELWHSDSSFRAVSAGPSLLSARELPPIPSETQFADCRAAWEALPARLKQRIEGLSAEHSLAHSRALTGYRQFNEAERKAFPPVLHPIVRRHPRTARHSLFIGSHAGRIVGMPDAEARALLLELLTFATQERFTYTHTWRLHDLIVWDNRCVLHRRAPFDIYSHRRDMRRTTVAGAERMDGGVYETSR